MTLGISSENESGSEAAAESNSDYNQNRLKKPITIIDEKCWSNWLKWAVAWGGGA